MHRTRNALRLLTTVAALAVCGCVSGCVSVESGPAPSPPPAPAADSGRSSRLSPQIAQPPAREALEAIAPTSPPAAPPPPPVADRRQAVGHGRHHRTEQPRHQPAAPATPHPRPAPAPPVSGDVCALGQGYAGWRADSPEARICHQVYGH
ncbi:hypothetical protein ABZX93_25325 [Streptomyces sp. NPDC006632]|uniref:hypothetical protein n=1 Tax=unclassified Streptomyces TaxID=2593676 RepID=UPI002E1DFF2F